MRGSTIVLSTNGPPRGSWREMTVKTGQTFYPGMAVQTDSSVALVEGVHTAKIYDADIDGGRPKGALYVVTEILQVEQGKTITDSIAAGERCMCYCPLPGDQLNILLGDVAGTGSPSDFAAEDIVIPDDTTGLFILSTGTPEIEPFKLLETQADLTANSLCWAEYTGY